MRRVLAVAVSLLLATAVFADQRITVAFNGNSVPADAVAMVEAAGGHVVLAVPEVGVMEVTGSEFLLAALGARNDVAAANPSIDFQLPQTNATQLAETDAVNFATADLYKKYQWDIKQVTNNGASFGLDPGSHNTIVGIVDTGVATSHPALMANLLGGRNFVDDDNDGVVNPDDIEDRQGHGTHVAGAIAGNGRIFGVGPELAFRSYRVFGASGGASTANIAAAIVAAVRDKVDVISMSIGGFDGMAGGWWTSPAGIVYRFKDVADFLAYRRAVQFASQNGVVVVAAAGNEGFNIGNPALVTSYLNFKYGEYGYYFIGASREAPGTVAGVVTVSATGPDTSLASYSNYGNPIDVAAPGGEDKRYPTPGWHLDMCLSSYPGGYVWMDGTSMATPKVSAVAALIIDQAKAKGQTLTPAQTIARLKGSAIDLGKPGSDPYYGFGFVSAFNALNN